MDISGASAAFSVYANRLGERDPEEEVTLVMSLITDLIHMIAVGTNEMTIEHLGYPEDPLDLLRTAERQFLADRERIRAGLAPY